jgi:hypothetical protein
MIIIEAESTEDVIALLKKDVYYTKGVWDVDNVAVIPMKVSIIRSAGKDIMLTQTSMDAGNQPSSETSGQHISK